MKYISLDLSVVNEQDDISSLTSMAMLFCDTESKKEELLEFNVIHDSYLVNHGNMERASSSFLSILKKERAACYSENLQNYISRKLFEFGSSEGDKILIVTNDLAKRVNILKRTFDLYDLELFNIPNFTSEKDDSYTDICNLQSEYFEKYQNSLK
jgi:hypothetical protein